MSRSLFKVSSRFSTPYFRERIAAQGVVTVPQTQAFQPRLAFAPLGTGPARDVLICIFQRGGMDGLSALVPHGEGANYYDLRPTVAVPAPGQTNGCLDLGGGFGLHPSLAPLHQRYQQGKLAIVRATGCIDPTRSHFDAMRYMEQGVPGDKTVASGWIARHLQTASTQNTSPLRAVGFGSLVQASLRGSSALAMESIADFHLEGRYDQIAGLRAQIEALYHVNAPQGLLDRQAKLVLETIDLLQTLDGSEYTPANGATYPDDYFGMQLKQCAQLIKADVGLEIACIDIGGWDTHETQGTNETDGWFKTLLSTLAQGIDALYTDLGTLTANVTIVTMSEFGRRVEENASKGTDHGHGNNMFILGGGVNGGQIYGEWPTLAPDALNDGDLEIKTDQRHVLAELLSKRLLNTSTSIFPNFTASPLGIFQQR
jgi:uncharacterized protein (DUF1501 family)